MAKAWFGVLGNPVAHSVSPAMMQAAFRENGLDAVYLAHRVLPNQVGDAMRGLAALGATGVNVTIPHKQAVLAFTTDLTPEAELAGAVNTLLFRDDGQRITGHNTDAVGWWKSVSPVLPQAWKRVSILGAGGAARGVLTALALYAPTCEITLVGRDTGKTERLAVDFENRLAIRVAAWPKREQIISASDLAVNATSIGMWPKVTDCPIEDDQCFRTGQVVQDMVYNPLRTVWLKRAGERGAVTVDGLQMLVEQGVAAYAFWMGQAAPADVMRAAALAALGPSVQAEHR